LQWPCPHPDHPGTSFLHEGRFTRGKGLFVVPAHTPPREPTDDAYPFILTTGRMFAHYHTATMTRRSAFLDREAPLAYVEIAPADAARLDIADGDAVTVSSRRGSIRSTARVTDRVPPGLIFAPFHFTESRANVLTNPVLDPASKIPEFKVCAVRLEKGAGGTP
jgi:predicted molibdopterin-dependent oxidoreductase YjgC